MIRTAACALAAAALLWARPALAGYSNGQPAAAAVGQADLVSSGINGSPGIGAAGFSAASGVWSDGTTLIVSDTGNHRVLIYNSVPVANGTPADVVIGQPDPASNVANQGGAPAANTLSSPTGVFFDGSTLYVADTGNNRVLLYFGLPISNNTAADVVVGQTSFSTGAVNQGGAVGAGTMSVPQGVYSDGTSLYVSDTGNNRVLVFNTIPAVNGASANVAVGQASLSAGAVNAGTTTKAYTLSSPGAVRAQGGNLYVGDRGNNRVLIYNPVPTVNATSATYVVGQATFTTNSFVAASSFTLASPAGLDTDGTRLFVSDSANNRVLIWNSVPAGNGVGANLVLGQAAMNAGTANRGASRPSANTLAGPAGVIFDGTQLYVADRANNRVLIFNPLPSSNGPPASLVVGQTGFTSGAANLATSRPGAATMFRPSGVRTDNGRLYAADRSNNRVLIYNTAPGSSGASADVVVGQLNKSTGSANLGGAFASTNTLSAPSSVFGDGTRLFVSDTSNNRVLIYSPIPSSDGALASVVVGQAGFTGSTFNQGIGPRAQTLGLPTDAVTDGTRLYVADRSNNRVLIYNPIPAANNASAAAALGQTALNTNTPNQGGLSAFSLNNPTGLATDGTRLFVADQINNRVLIYYLPVVTHSSATVVVGQPNMTSNLPNQGLSAPTNATLRNPSAVHTDGASLYVVDAANNRLLVYTPIPTVNGAAAAVVIGQSSFTAMSTNQGQSVGPTTLANPNGVCVDSTTGRMYLADTNSNRALLFLPSVLAPIGAGGATVTLNSPVSPTLVQAMVPPGALPPGVNLTLGVQTNLPGPASPAQTPRGTGIGFQITLDQPQQPASLVTLSLTYNPADVAGLDPSKLVIARYDDAASAWVPLPSISDPGNRRVVAQTNHFSTFQLMQIDPAGNDLSNVRVFPNPFQPPAGHTAMTFASLPPGGRVRIYAITGLVLKDLTADANGIARWDGTNQAGANVASGVYYAFVQGTGRSRMFTVAVQR